ncbi:MAG: HupE/UreJ family protein [bacterium]|nr:hypothetical protein [Deltaproteobacteria bacterium]MCP4906919.1 HupE/UreJ family protein [bacterium]
MVCVLVALLLSSSAMAHGRSISYSSWEIDATGAKVSLRLKLLELSRLGPQALPPGSLSTAAPPGSPDLPARAFPTELVLIADGRPCSPESVAQRRPDAPGWIRYQWRINCPENAEHLAIRSQILLAVAPSHMHFARARFVEISDVAREQVLTEASPQFVLRQFGETRTETASGHRLVDYLVLGVEHILTGWDHLAFVFGLLLLSTRLADVARLVTGFTLAHSVTLALAVLDIVHPRAAAVEGVIAFSVGLVAIEKGWLLAGRPRIVPAMVLAGLGILAFAALAGIASIPLLTVVGLIVFSGCYFALIARSENEWLRVCLTFAFGLVHGFGFAGILVELALPADRLVPALLGFNLGVEVGQIGVVFALWPLLWIGRRWTGPRFSHLAGELSAAGLCGLGVYWLVERAFST